ncbi:MAG: MCP four helix bundle domain-containing protein [Comamonas sp.]|nr:MCP four helix bundle domain-containing protein [Comamonas sp.]
MQLSTLKVGARLWLGFVLLLVIMAIVAVVGVWRLQDMAQVTNAMTTTDAERLRATMQWREAVNQNWIRTRAILLSNDSSLLDNWKSEVDTTSGHISQSQNKVQSLLRTAEGKRMFEVIGQRREAYRTQRADLMKRKANLEDVWREVDNQLRPLADAYSQSLADFEKYQYGVYDQTRVQALDNARMGQIILLAGLAAALALGVFAAWAIGRSITLPLRQAVDYADAMAQGDLTQTINTAGKDETAALLTALHNMQAKLQSTVGNVRQNAESVASASTEIAHGNNDLSARTEQQASALQQTAASMEQLGSTVRQNADNAAQANQLAMSASTLATQSGGVVEEMVTTMRDIQGSSSRIADIISVIDGIAFQTNILALNAAVEAARAGEQGRGFAVVASEVRALAGRSADAAKEITTLIQDSVQRVEQGTQLADRTGSSMTEMLQAIRRVTDIMGEISAASREQSAGVSQVGEAITQMDQATQQNAALVEESAAAADNLRHQAAELVQAMSVFRTAQGHGSAAPMHTRSPAPAAAAQASTPAPHSRPVASSKPSATAGTTGTVGTFSKPRPTTGMAAAPRTAQPAALPSPAPALKRPAPSASASSSHNDDDWETF